MLKWRRSLAAAMAIAMLRVLCYVFVHKFLFNAHFDLEPDYIIRKPIVYTEFNDIFYIGKYCQLFTHKSIIDQYVFSPLKRVGCKFRKMSETMPETAPSP